MPPNPPSTGLGTAPSTKQSESLKIKSNFNLKSKEINNSDLESKNWQFNGLNGNLNKLNGNCNGIEKPKSKPIPINGTKLNGIHNGLEAKKSAVQNGLEEKRIPLKNCFEEKETILQTGFEEKNLCLQNGKPTIMNSIKEALNFNSNGSIAKHIQNGNTESENKIVTNKPPIIKSSKIDSNSDSKINNNENPNVLSNCDNKCKPPPIPKSLLNKKILNVEQKLPFGFRPISRKSSLTPNRSRCSTPCSQFGDDDDEFDNSIRSSSHQEKKPKMFINKELNSNLTYSSESLCNVNNITKIDKPPPVPPNLRKSITKNLPFKSANTIKTELLLSKTAKILEDNSTFVNKNLSDLSVINESSAYDNVRNISDITKTSSNLGKLKSLSEFNDLNGKLTRSGISMSREPSLSLLSRSPSPLSTISNLSSMPSSIYDQHIKLHNKNLDRASSLTRRVLISPDNVKPTDNTRANSIPKKLIGRPPTPRRVFPQSHSKENSLDLSELKSLEQSPVVIDANLSFILNSKKQSVRQNFHAAASHSDPKTASNLLSDRISSFLKRTDHVMEEWKILGENAITEGRRARSCSRIGFSDDTINLIERQREKSAERGESRLGRSRSAANILLKGFQLTKNLPRTPRSRSSSVVRDYSRDFSIDLSMDDDYTIREDESELSEMAVDLAEERSASNLTSERLDGETAERLKLEKELNEQQSKVKNLQEHSEKLEMELICAKSDLNGISDDEDHDNDDNNGGIYKLKFERVARELEFTKRRLQTQHEHDLEQLVGLKKQLEKKLADAYEEVEEQRQVVSQWKRKAQKMTNEQNDLRMLLEEQNGRNNLLEKKQRKFDSECQALQDASRQERQAKDRLCREKDVLIAEKFTLEQNLADTRLELDLKEEKLAALQRELEEMTFGGGTEEEIAQLRRSKNELERRVKEQEEELDEMAGQVQLLEQAKLRLEMTLETMRKEARREAQQRDEELEEARGSAYKKLRGLECQLETEHEERTLLLREKHELERRLQMFEEQERADRQADEAVNQKLRKDLRKYKALLKDAHAQLERLKADSPGKALIRQLRNQLEDAETARTLAMKARQTAESELTEVQGLYEEAQRAKHEAEDKATVAQRDRAELQAQIEENEEEMSELMKKYTTTVKQLNNEQNAMSEYEIRISELEAERNSLKEQIADLQARLENIENTNDPTAAVQTKRLELRAKELESRLELEQATRARLEVQANRHKDSVDKLQNEITQSKMRELTSQDALKKSQKTLRELREELHTISSREQESLNRRKDLEKKIETCEAESTSVRNDLRLALQRIADLQQAMEEGDDDITESESDSSEGSLSDLEERLKPIQVKRTSLNSTTNGDTKIVLKQKSENSPSITVTTPTSKGSSLNDSLLNGESSYA